MWTIQFVKGNTTYYYKVEADKEELLWIRDKLQKYSYKAIEKVQLNKGLQIYRSLIKLPDTKEAIRKRVTRYFFNNPKYNNCFLHPETIERKKCLYLDDIYFEYSYEKYPELYYYISILIWGQVNDSFKHLERFESLSLQYPDVLERIMIEKIIAYRNSPELREGNPQNVGNEREYDYKGLNELYDEVLSKLQFTLVAKKEIVENQEPINGKKLIRERKQTNKNEPENKED